MVAGAKERETVKPELMIPSKAIKQFDDSIMVPQPLKKIGISLWKDEKVFEIRYKYDDPVGSGKKLEIIGTGCTVKDALKDFESKYKKEML